MKQNSQLPAFRISRKRLYTSILAIFSVIILCVAILAWLLEGVDWSFLENAQASVILYIIGLTILGTIIYTYMIHVMVIANGFKSNLISCYLSLTMSLTGNYITPIKLGLPLRVYFYKNLLDIPVAAGTSLITTEMLTGAILPLILAIVGIFYFYPQIGFVAPLFLLLMIFIFLAFVIYTPKPIINFFESRKDENNGLSKFIKLLLNLHVNFITQSGKGIVAAILFYLSILLLQTLRLWFVIYLFAEPPGFIHLLFILTISLTIGNISFIPMGLGTRDISLIFLLINSGLQSEFATSVAIILRLLSPGWPLILGIISLHIYGLKRLSLNSTR